MYHPDFILLGKEKPLMKDVEDYVVIKLASQWKELGNQLNIDKDSLIYCKRIIQMIVRSVVARC